MKASSSIFRVAITLALITHSTLIIAAEKATEAPQKPVEASIPFANQGGIRDWRVMDDVSLRIQDTHGQWYIAKLQSPAWDLHFAESIGFETLPSGTLEKFGAVIVKGRRYAIISLTRTDPPAKRRISLPDSSS